MEILSNFFIINSDSKSLNSLIKNFIINNFFGIFEIKRHNRLISIFTPDNVVAIPAP